MTTRPRVAVVLGAAGLGVAAAQALLLSSPPTWFQIAVVAFWGVVGTAYLASGLGQRVRDRLRPQRSRVPDGELSTGGPGEDADVVRRDDVRPSTREMPAVVGAGGDDVGPGESTEIVPPVAATPVRPARARPGAATVVPAPQGLAAPLRHAPVVAGRAAPPSLTPAPSAPAGADGGIGPARAVLPGHPLPASAAAPAPMAPPAAIAPPTAAETTTPRISPWPHAASPIPAAPAGPVVPSDVPVPAPSDAPATAAIPVPEAAAIPVPEAPPASAVPVPEVAAIPAPGAPPAPPTPPEPVDRTPVDPGPGTSPSFALRYAGAGLSFGAGASGAPGESSPLPTPRKHASGRHAVPDEQPADEVAPRRNRHRRPTDTLEQPAVPAMSGAPAPARRRHRASSRRRAS